MIYAYTMGSATIIEVQGCMFEQLEFRVGGERS